MKRLFLCNRKDVSHYIYESERDVIDVSKKYNLLIFASRQQTIK